jgi:hypothetical protein
MNNEHEKNRQGEQETKERDGSEAGREPAVPQELKSGSGKAMTGQQLGKAAHDGDAAKVSTLLPTQGALSFINYQDAHGSTPLHLAAQHGHAAVTEKLLEARCNVDPKIISRRSTKRPKMGMLPSRSSCLQLAVTLISRRRTALLRCKLLRAGGTPESPR